MVESIEQTDEYYTVAEVATKLKVQPRAVRAWISDGRLLACRVADRTIRIKKSDFEAYVNISRGAPRG
jgi:excisionase family DNA binding protein